MNKFALALLVTSFSLSAHAVDIQPPGSAVPSPEVPATKTADSKVPFESLSKAEKIKLIEEKHAASRKKSELKWKMMSDDEKIAQYQKRRERFVSWKNKGKTPAEAGFGNNASAAAPAAGSSTIKN